MKATTTVTHSVLMAASLLLVLAGCQFGEAEKGAPASTTPTSITGQAFKGRFVQGATVTCRQVNSPNAQVTGSIIDNKGTYSCNATWTGPTSVSVSGPFIDDFTGQQITQTTPLQSIVNVATAGTAITGEVNLATSIAAQIVNDLLAAAPSTTITAASITAANLQVTQAILGVGSTVDISQVRLSNTADPNATQLLAFLTAVTAQSGTGSNGANVIAAVKQLADNVQTGVTLGTAVAGITSPITSAQLTTNLTAIQTNQPLTVTGVAAPVTVSAVLANAGTGQTVSQVQSQTNPNQVLTVLRGFTLLGNALSIGDASGTVAIANNQGAATISGATARGNVKAKFTLSEFTNAAGTGPSNGQTYEFPFGFFFASTNPTSDLRTITGWVDKVQFTTDTGTIVSVAVPAGAVFSFSGKNAQGVVVTGTATNLAKDSGFFSIVSGSMVQLDLNALLSLVQGKVGGDLQILNTAGTYTFTFSFGNNVGIANSTGIGIERLLPTNLSVPGRAIQGTITLT